LVSGVAAGLVFVACLLLLARRRWAIPELRRLSRPGDYFLLGLLVGVAGTGLWLRCTATPTDLAAARSYLGGLLSLRPGALPQPVLFVLHLTLVNVLLSWFPFSKLVHLAGGIIARSLLVRPAPIYPTPAGAAPSGGLHAGGGRRP
jgi:nitrate reductase gamma subunit